MGFVERLGINVTHASRIQQVASARAVLHDHDVSVYVLRVVATLMVILINTSAKGFAGLIPHWWAVNTCESVSRVFVPIFFMITGALLLPRSHNIRSVIKRSWRIAFVLLVWSLIFLVYGRFKATPPSLPSVSQGLK
jgi:surface polysaccharide O-acyltransferase-like enzyme